MIVVEVVHNAPPEDRIQLARTCKYINEAVKRAKPKKIINCLYLCGGHSDINAFTQKSSEELTDILPQIQIEKLFIIALPFSNEFSAQRLQFLQLLFEASKFATSLNFYMLEPLENDIIDFYRKFRNLKEVGTFVKLPHYPSKIWLPSFMDNYVSNGLLEHIAEQSRFNLISFLQTDINVPIIDFLQFIQSVKCQDGAKFDILVVRPNGEKVRIYLTFIADQNSFEMQAFDENLPRVEINQESYGVDGKTIRIKFADWSKMKGKNISFEIIVASRPNEPVFYGKFPRSYDAFSFTKVKPNEWIKIKRQFPSSDKLLFQYSQKMLEENFPRNEFASIQERYKAMKNENPWMQNSAR
uniref:Uncharacterized protein n=1 Tax=Panagrolaimus sp. JU765 TaxID=591449 RepID=A0AC34QF12_9BILA